MWIGCGWPFNWWQDIKRPLWLWEHCQRSDFDFRHSYLCCVFCVGIEAIEEDDRRSIFLFSNSSEQFFNQKNKNNPTQFIYSCNIFITDIVSIPHPFPSHGGKLLSVTMFTIPNQNIMVNVVQLKYKCTDTVLDFDSTATETSELFLFWKYSEFLDSLQSSSPENCLPPGGHTILRHVRRV